MEIEVKYSREEAREIIVKYHESKFGPAPDGYEWSARETYGMMVVENVEKKTEVPEINSAE